MSKDTRHNETHGDDESRFDESVRYNARVKWFNRTSGWGFLSLTNSANEQENDDVFVHWKSLDVQKEQYKYLMKGEYVSLNVKYTPDNEHSYHANGVSGIDGGPLMCETRLLEQENNNVRRTSRRDQSEPRGGNGNGNGEWKRVDRHRNHRTRNGGRDNAHEDEM
jgi:cold shock CspA family protein